MLSGDILFDALNDHALGIQRTSDLPQVSELVNRPWSQKSGSKPGSAIP